MGAAGLPFLIGRLKRNQKVTPGVADPVEALAQLYFDSILHDLRVLQFVIAMLGADRLMMGSDMPFPIGDEEPMKIIAAAGLKPDQVARSTAGSPPSCSGSDNETPRENLQCRHVSRLPGLFS